MHYVGKHCPTPTPPPPHLPLPTLPHTSLPHLSQLCNDASLERHAGTNLPLKAMATQYVANLKVASAAALGKM